MNFNAEDYLAHHGIKGQKWGVRRFQNEDGSLTGAGKAAKQKNERSNGGVARTRKVAKTSNDRQKMSDVDRSVLKEANRLRKRYAIGRRLQGAAIGASACAAVLRYNGFISHRATMGVAAASIGAQIAGGILAKQSQKKYSDLYSQYAAYTISRLSGQHSQ